MSCATYTSGATRVCPTLHLLIMLTWQPSGQDKPGKGKTRGKADSSCIIYVVASLASAGGGRARGWGKGKGQSTL